MTYKRELVFSLPQCDKLDSFALLAHQVYNLGNRANWFTSFRGGLYGFYSRLYGVTYHYNHIYNWTEERKDSVAIEYHISSLLFNMDSALECLVFSVNALGCSSEAPLFQDVEKAGMLKRVSPNNIIGSNYEGYSKYFPKFTESWMENKSLIGAICEQHDVSKHRSTVFVGGLQRTDVPFVFSNKIQEPDSIYKKYYYSPWENILLRRDPKRVPSKLATELDELPIKLETLCEGFKELIHTLCENLLDDAIESISFPYLSLLKQKQVVYYPDIILYKDSECTKVEEGVWGLMLGTEIKGFIILSASLVPVTRYLYYKKGNILLPNANHSKTWGKLWYVDPFSTEKKLAFENSCEYVGVHKNEETH